MATLFTVVLLATIAGIAVGAMIINPAHLLGPQVAGLLLMMLGSWIDSHATNLVRPEQMYVSQGMLAFGGVLFLGPVVVSLLGAVIANPANLISFSVLFGLTQNLGALLGSSLLGTFQVMREKFHSSQLADSLNALDPLVAARIAQGGAAYGKVLPTRCAHAPGHFRADPGRHPRGQHPRLQRCVPGDRRHRLRAGHADPGARLYNKYIVPQAAAPAPMPQPALPTDSPIAVPSGDRRLEPRAPLPTRQ
jgi:uncharacterized protein (DUF697 family)